MKLFHGAVVLGTPNTRVNMRHLDADFFLVIYCYLLQLFLFFFLKLLGSSFSFTNSDIVPVLQDMNAGWKSRITTL